MQVLAHKIAGAMQMSPLLPDRKLFFLPPEGVERLIGAAHQQGILEYDAAGTATRLTFPRTPWQTMPISSPRQHIEILKADLKARPPRMTVYHDLSFAILRYEPPEERKRRWEAWLPVTRLVQLGLNKSIV